MGQGRTSLAVFLAFWALGLSVSAALGAGPASTGPAPPASTRPVAPRSIEPATSAPSTQPVKAKLGPVLAQRWRWYRTVWAGRDIASQAKADQQLVAAILKADPAEVATLRDEMAGEYARLAAVKKPDDFQLARLAARLVVAWTRSPRGKGVSSPQKAVNRELGCREICRWGTIALTHLGGGISPATLKKYRGFVPGTAASVISLMTMAIPTINNPGKLREQLLPLREPLRALAAASTARQADVEKAVDRFYQLLAPLDVVQQDKDAIRKVVEAFPAAYNSRDVKAFTALWPAGHPAVAPLKNHSLAETIEPDFWTIICWRCVYIVVEKDRASAYIVSQYRSKDGKDQPVRLQGFPARKNPKYGWKLD